jgi:Ser/Thr protein kinase RdoA (MazF antagonist)
MQCLAEHYGIKGAVSRLSGENLNYLVTSATGERFVLKIVDEDMPADMVALENRVIAHALSHGFSHELPQTIENQNRTYETGIILHNNQLNRARLITFIDGIQLDSMSDISDITRSNVGIALAGFDLSMKNFHDPVAVRNHRWNLAQADQHRSKLALFDDPGRLDLLNWAFDCWSGGAKEKLQDLPWQFIHGDAHGENILMNGDEVKGLIDFGDSCFNPTICELGVSLPYLMMGQDHPYQAASEVLAAYHGCSPISEQEFAVLIPLICGRLASSICVAEARRRENPNHPNWFDSVSDAWNLLNYLFETDAEPGNTIHL